ncbi:hypothetical protein AYK87_05330 [Stutzerimonas stutzeri]|nr:hypothetical protein AYK87_05330 [Stutzerimonas stutzeri]
MIHGRQFEMRAIAKKLHLYFIVNYLEATLQPCICLGASKITTAKNKCFAIGKKMITQDVKLNLLSKSPQLCSQTLKPVLFGRLVPREPLH